MQLAADQPPDHVYDTLKDLVLCADLGIKISKCKNELNEYQFGGRRISAFVKNNAVCVRVKQE